MCWGSGDAGAFVLGVSCRPAGFAGGRESVLRRVGWGSRLPHPHGGAVQVGGTRSWPDQVSVVASTVTLQVCGLAG